MVNLSLLFLHRLLLLDFLLLLHLNVKESSSQTRGQELVDTIMVGLHIHEMDHEVNEISRVL